MLLIINTGMFLQKMKVLKVIPLLGTGDKHVYQLRTGIFIVTISQKKTQKLFKH